MKTLMLFFCLNFLVACGTRTGTGATGTGEVVLQSQAFSTSRALALFSPRWLAPPSAVDSFKFCIEKIKLENDSDQAVGLDGKDEIEFRPGLIDVSSGQVTSWGSPEIPTGFSLKRIKVDVHKDEELCGSTFSVRFNEFQTQEGIEFKFRFNPAITVNAGDTLSLSLAQVVSSLQQAAGDSALSDENLKEYIEAIEESGEKD